MPVWLDKLTRDANEALWSQSALPAYSYLQLRQVPAIHYNPYQLGFGHSELDLSQTPPEFQHWAERYFLGNLVFPLRSPSGETIGIQTRVLNEPESGPRYQQFYTYPQETYPYFFGFPQAFMPICALNQVVIVEGVFDYFAVKNYAENTLAILTAGVPVSSRNFFRRFTKRVISCLDGDASGDTASERLKGNSFQVVRLHMLHAKDPGQLLAEGRDDPSLYRLLGLASQKL